MATTNTQRTTLAQLDMAPGKKTRLYRLLYQAGPANGTLMVLPIDQGLEHGPRDFLDAPDSADPEFQFRLAVEGRYSAIACQIGLAAKYYPRYAGQVPLILKLNGKTEIPSRAYVAAFGFKGGDQQKLAGVMSGGERNRVNLALTLKQGGNLLLLDEPTNDLDVETLSSLENALLDFPGCAVITSHDRWFLDRIATHILAWEGDSNWFWFEGNFEAYEKNKIERLGAEAARPHRVTYRKLTRG